MCLVDGWFIVLWVSGLVGWLLGSLVWLVGGSVGQLMI
jgi:hypothetical protein